MKRFANDGDGLRGMTSKTRMLGGTVSRLVCCLHMSTHMTICMGFTDQPPYRPTDTHHGVIHKNGVYLQTFSLDALKPIFGET